MRHKLASNVSWLPIPIWISTRTQRLHLLAPTTYSFRATTEINNPPRGPRSSQSDVVFHIPYPERKAAIH